MAPPAAQARNLTLTEELEKLEQSITLTLQEIDHNFSNAHRIVTTSILPLVEQYGQHSRAVWEASKFWKQFFEASANVSLSGYEELAHDDEDATQLTADEHDESSAMRDDDDDVTARTAEYTPRQRSEDATATVGGGQRTYMSDASLLDDGDGDLTGSTPRPPATKTIRPQMFANLESPYEAMKREMRNEGAHERDLDQEDEEEDSTVLLQQHTARLPDMSMTPRSSLAPTDPFPPTGARQKDPLLHRILDKNYRLQATPHKGAKRISPIQRGRGKEADGEKDADTMRTKIPSWADSPMSSPIMAAPTLRSEAFLSPVRNPAARNKLLAAPRTPGVSVNTPASRKTRDALLVGGVGVGEEHEPTVQVTEGKKKKTYEISWESDSDDDTEALYGGMSPPKTIQFALPPSKLLQTPAREASKRIVEDILLTAGADAEDTGEYSPTMVKMNEDILNESF